MIICRILSRFFVSIKSIKFVLHGIYQIFTLFSFLNDLAQFDKGKPSLHIIEVTYNMIHLVTFGDKNPFEDLYGASHPFLLTSFFSTLCIICLLKFSPSLDRIVYSSNKKCIYSSHCNLYMLY